MLQAIALPSSFAGEKRHPLRAVRTGSSRSRSVALLILALVMKPFSSISIVAETMPSNLLGFLGATLFLTAGGVSQSAADIEGVNISKDRTTRVPKRIIDFKWFMRVVF